MGENIWLFGGSKKGRVIYSKGGALSGGHEIEGDIRRKASDCAQMMFFFRKCENVIVHT